MYGRQDWVRKLQVRLKGLGELKGADKPKAPPVVVEGGRRDNSRNPRTLHCPCNATAEFYGFLCGAGTESTALLPCWYSFANITHASFSLLSEYYCRIKGSIHTLPKNSQL